ncbi:outer membrane protein OmpA-like peptidoglycan-associated protein [Actinoplanes octamycinicus]|uniref:Outer membrane protein OmpA-like peptidoglycan-associated protein n=1 Tax=Actinoplanes octamycinicus TaxID=135948 RepID=A0A7W7GY70_9ACTN|nr:OmpA family protein [Actinoplanes octamycinicus]MBB4740302.1 outer membrane protein OmpA-like peptidoglycan-associated protein [Actinoplanes octamycinicus]GIE62622.1 hypothetical protein Aoc01nite_80240 [Actinoplanes octamycinicus]
MIAVVRPGPSRRPRLSGKARRRLAVLLPVAGLAALLAAQLGPNRHRIENDLERRCAQALTAAGQPAAEVTFTGRDGVVVVGSAADADRAQRIVAAVDGVRTVRAEVASTPPVRTEVEPTEPVGTPPAPTAGTPPTASAPTPSTADFRAQLSALPPLTFPTDGAELTAASRASLHRIAALLAANPSVRLRLEGHTDSRGSRRTNLRLSRQRAEAVRAVLLADGVAAHRLTVAAYGETRPLVPDDTPAHRARNRRVEPIATG